MPASLQPAPAAPLTELAGPGQGAGAIRRLALSAVSVELASGQLPGLPGPGAQGTCSGVPCHTHDPFPSTKVPRCAPGPHPRLRSGFLGPLGAQGRQLTAWSSEVSTPSYWAQTRDHCPHGGCWGGHGAWPWAGAHLYGRGPINPFVASTAIPGQTELPGAAGTVCPPSLGAGPPRAMDEASSGHNGAE